MTWGPHREGLIHIAETDKKGFVPTCLLVEPELPYHLAAWMEAFHALSMARGLIVASNATKALRIPQPLAVSEILTAADAFGLPRQEFLHVAQILDQAYLAHEIRNQ